MNPRSVSRLEQPLVEIGAQQRPQGGKARALEGATSYRDQGIECRANRAEVRGEPFQVSGPAIGARLAAGLGLRSQKLFPDLPLPLGSARRPFERALGAGGVAAHGAQPVDEAQ